MHRKIFSKTCSLLLVFILTVSIIPFSASAATTYSLMYQNTFTAEGKLISATKNVAGTDIVKGYTMAQGYTYYNGDFRWTYCLDMGNHPYSKNLVESTNSTWTKLNKYKQEAIQNIIALGLSGSFRGSYTSTKDFPNTGAYPKANGARVKHYIYGNSEYGSGDFSDSEIYIATQLLVWEVTQGYRKPGTLNKTSKSLLTAYSGGSAGYSHIKKVYDFIVDRLYTVNEIPSFTVWDKTDPDIKTYNFKVTYDRTTLKYSVSPEKRSLTSTNKNVLKHYPDLATNKSIAFTNTDSKTMYVNIVAEISGNTLTLTPSVSSTALYSKSTQMHSVEKDLPSSGTEVKAAVIAYMPAPGEAPNGQDQLSIKTSSCKIDPKDAYFNVSASFAATGTIDRSFTVTKDIRIKSDTISTGYKTDDSTVASMESGYYYYVKLPTTTGNTSYTVVEDGKLVTKEAASQRAADVLGLKTSSVCYNKTLDEYYIIMGPTRSDSETAPIEKFLRNYANADTNSSNMPYGNYYIYELGKADKSKGWAKTDTLSGSTSYQVDMNPNHYTMPEGVESYEFTYAEHFKAVSEGWGPQAVRVGLNIDEKGNRITGTQVSIEYYNRLKRVLRSQTSTTDVSPTSRNLLSMKARIKKSAIDGKTGDVYFKIQKQNSKGVYVDYDITNLFCGDEFKDEEEFENYITKNNRGPGSTDNGVIKTIKNADDGLGYTPYIYLTEGNYKIIELGYLESKFDYEAKKGYYAFEFPERAVIPDDIYFSITDGDIVKEYSLNGGIEFDVENLVDITLRIIKTGTDDEEIAGATFELYNDKMNLISTLTTGECEVDGVAHKGYAEIDGLTYATYYLKEVEAPPGYVLDDTIQDIVINTSTLDRGKLSTITNHITRTLSNEPTETYISKKAVTGDDELSGANFVVSWQESGRTQYIEWVSTSEPKLIYGLKQGVNYRLTETISPDGYATTNSINFTINEDGSPTYITMRDDVTKYSFIKVDEKGNPLEGAVLQLLDDQHRLLKSWTTDGTEYVLNGYLVVGKTYYLHEQSVPNKNYKLSDDVKFTVEDTPDKQTITMTDEYNLGSVTLTKQDGYGDNIAGSEYNLFTSEDEAVKVLKTADGKYKVDDTNNANATSTLVTDEKGILFVEELPQGDYYFVETKAPSGKMVYGEKIEFSIDGDTELNPSVVVKDDNPMLPKTGGSGYALPMCFGLGIVVIPIIYFVISRRRKYNEI